MQYEQSSKKKEMTKQQGNSKLTEVCKTVCKVNRTSSEFIVNNTLKNNNLTCTKKVRNSNNNNLAPKHLDNQTWAEIRSFPSFSFPPFLSLFSSLQKSSSKTGKTNLEPKSELHPEASEPDFSKNSFFLGCLPLFLDVKCVVDLQVALVIIISKLFKKKRERKKK